MNRTSIAAAVLAFVAIGAQAQTAADNTAQRDVNQQQRIESGLKSGQLSTGEAARLEREQGRVDKMQANALKDGKVTPQERARLNAEQNQVSRDIAAARHNGVTGNPQSASSKRMQADVQRDVNQEKRVEAGLQDGSLTPHEAGKLERGQAHVDHREAVAGRNGHVGVAEQAGIQRAENKQSRRIHRQRHDAQVHRPA